MWGGIVLGNITMAVVGNIVKVEITERMTLSLALILFLIFELSARNDERNSFAVLSMLDINLKLVKQLKHFLQHLVSNGYMGKQQRERGPQSVIIMMNLHVHYLCKHVKSICP